LSVRVFLSDSACALPRPSATASAKLANSTVNHSHRMIWKVKARLAPPVTRSRRKITVVSVATTSTTNITGLLIITLGSSLAKAEPMAGITIFGSSIAETGIRLFIFWTTSMDVTPKCDRSEQGVAGEPSERRAIIASLRDIGVQDFGETMRPSIRHRGNSCRIDNGDSGPTKIHQRQHQDREHRHLDFARLDLLADIFRRAADHQASDEDRQHDEQQHAVKAGADAADDDFTELHVDQRNHAAMRGETIMHGVDRAAGGRRGDDGKQCGTNDDKTDFLAFHIAAGETECIEPARAVSFSPVADSDASDEQHAHHAEDCPALALIADHAAEHVGQRGAEREDRDHLDEVRQRGGVLERMRSISIEEAAAI